MGNVCLCGQAAASSSSDNDAQYQQLLQDLKVNADISLDNLDTLLDAMEAIFSKLKHPNEASSSSSSESVTQSATVGRNIVNTLSAQIQSQLTPTIPKCTCIGHGQMSARKMKDLVTRALDSRTMKLVGDVLDKTQNIPYIGVAASIVVYLMEQYERSSSNAQDSMELLQHLFDLVKCMKDVVPDDNANQMFQDMLCFIVKSTLSVAQQMNQSSINRFANAYPDSKDLQSMRNALMLKYQHTQLRALMDIYKNVPRLPQAPSKVYCASNAVGIEGAMEEVKKKLNMIDESKKFVVIWGLGGIGKTTLGDHVYNSVVDKSKYSHCKLEMDIKSTDVPKLQFQLLNQVFQETEAVLNAGHGQGRIAKATDKISNQSKPLFLYIDNAIKERDVDSLLPTNSLSSLPQRSRIMVTTRNLKEVATWRGIPGFEVEEFKMEETPEGKKMLSYYALGDENVSFDQDVDVDELLDMCMGVPLIIQMAAKKLRDLNIRRHMDMSEACRNVTEHMQSLRKGEGWENDDMDRMVDSVYGQLPKSFQRIFLDIVFFFINWRRYKVVCIFGEIVIGELEDAALLSTNEKGRLKVHDIIKVRAHAISNGSRICDRDSWELVKQHPEKFNAIEGLHVGVEEDDMEYVSRCEKIRILILRRQEWKGPVKVHFPSSVEILYLKGHFVHNENLVNAFKVVKMKRNEFEQGFTSYQSFGQVKYLDLVRCKGIDISACFAHGPTSCRRLRLSDAAVELIPSGNNKAYYQLESLKLDSCYKLRNLPDTFIQHCSSIKILSLTHCETLKTLPPSFGRLKNLEKLVLFGCTSLKTLCKNFGSLSKLKELDIKDCESLQALPPSFGLLENLEKLDIGRCTSLRSLCKNFGSLSKLKELGIWRCERLQALPHSIGLLKNLETLRIRICTMLEDLPEGFKDMHALRILVISGCKNIKISADNLPPVHTLGAVEIDAVDEKMVDDLLRLPTVLHLQISDNFEKHIESSAWKYTPLPLIDMRGSHRNVLRNTIAECLLCGGGGGEYWRVEGDDDLVREEAQPENNNVALIITGLNPVSRGCREAVHRMAKEGYEIIYVDTGISRWKRYETAYQRQGRAFSGEVAWNQDDMQMMKRTLKELQLPSECVPRVWTSPFPKTCLTLAVHLYLYYFIRVNPIQETVVLKRCSLGEAASTTVEYEECYDKERSCEFGEVALPSLGIQNISSQGLADFAASLRWLRWN